MSPFPESLRADGEDLRAALLRLIAGGGGIEARRHFFPATQWDIIELIADARDSPHRGDTDWVEDAILGGEPLSPHCVGTLGDPIRYHSPAAAAELNSTFASIAPSDLPTGSDLAREVNELKDLLAEIVSRGEGILVGE